MSIRARVRDGDAEAFERLFTEFARSVHAHAFRLTGDRSAAEDVLSLTFLEAWRLRHRIDPDGGSLRPWLLGIATNVARNVRRADRKHERLPARSPGSGAVPDFADEVAARIDDAARLAAVRHALGLLHRREREVFALVVWSGLEYAEAAEALGVPVGTVRSRLSRARRRLEDLVAKGELPPPQRQERGDRISVRSTREGNR
ncbi:RNA polymerase sigma factor [Actinomadura sp. 7K507]|uniref:RNA polymerase sigma factor n=1 Tax=Actinomadura sp. 7K507 TaxID=2530365 RepID=UPI00104F66AB|nr:RNA polymerase sigma factor [Actinomadura sp. 7K507]TDC93969.1 RNA polymerase sigma factor [Actinomadura sp. 7K507]